MSNIRKIDIWGIPLTEHEPFSGACTMYIRERFVLCIQNNLQDLNLYAIIGLRLRLEFDNCGTDCCKSVAGYTLTGAIEKINTCKRLHDIRYAN